ncbi:MAG: ABC-2 family transporter protein [Lachnospiraceae bacterium]|nr:ABC-2 family transporter protein [Lachnospiraceae bacterium]MDE7204163.1 ABC-2 family transporter protein [Lachnospiraceae bacterium]
MKTTKLYLHYVSVNIRCMMQYKTSFLLTSIGQFLVSFNVFLGIFFMFQRFSKVEGFTYSEVLLCYAIILLEFALAEMTARGFDTFSGMVRSGEFDRILVRPQNEIVQVLGSKFELTRIGRIIQAVTMFVYGIMKSDVAWNFPKICTIVFMLIGGTAVFSALFLIYAALCFFTLDGLEFMNVFTDGAREFGKYPIGIYGKKMLLFTTFIIPYALIQYYPILYILDRRSSILYMFLPLAACWFLILAILLWKFGVRHYKSSGS